jgi:hypothetical protein
MPPVPINSNGKMVFERSERTAYMPIITLTAAVIKSFKKREITPRPACAHGFHCTTS